MDIKTQAITEYLTKGTGYRKLAAKYGVSRTTINKWLMIHQGIHNIPPTEKQQKYYLSGINSKPENIAATAFKDQQDLIQKVALLEKQLAWEKLRADALDTMINIAEEQLQISIRKKPGSQQSQK
ncbi:MAG TPA: helix-turn-helix domain-containing protein [Panacibacter sp.]|nr:helix-turn-helix domain-containing protein [Panacibacter sp.]